MSQAKPTAKRGRPPKTAAPQEAAPQETGAETTRQTVLGVTSPVAHSSVSLLEVQDSADLDALMLSPQLAPLVVARLDERVALVQPGKDKQLLELLRKAGHTPKVESR